MNFSLSYDYCCEKGRRVVNEDAVYPAENLTRPVPGLFMVCDGVGGASKGEIASHLAIRSFENFLMDRLYENDKGHLLESALLQAESDFDNHILQNPVCKGMSTTMALIRFNHDNVTVGHVGDSRVYHVRDGRLMFRTSDHSLVNELIIAGAISPDEARTHPQKNVITRAIAGSGPQATRIDVDIVTDIQHGDYFLLCTDGVLESFDDEEIYEHLSGLSPADVIVEIKKKCSATSKDNFAALVIKLEEIDENL